MQHETTPSSSSDHNRSPSKPQDTRRSNPGFGLADILNRSTSSAASSPDVHQPSTQLSPPKLTLPSLHSISSLNTRQQPSHREASFLSTSNRQRDTSRLNSLSEASSHSQKMELPPGEDEITRGGRWTADEHERFLAGFRMHGHKWKRVQQVVRTRSVTQVRTHAQKYLLKVAKLKAEKEQNEQLDTKASVTSSDKRYGISSIANSDQSPQMSGHSTAPPTPDYHHHYTEGYEDIMNTRTSSSPPRRQPSRKKLRKNDAGDSVDQEYIAAAATTLCYLMTQKIDSLFDTSQGPNDSEPYDCYPGNAPKEEPSDDQRPSEESRKRPYSHFLTDDRSPKREYSYEEEAGYSIEGKKLCP